MIIISRYIKLLHIKFEFEFLWTSACGLAISINRLLAASARGVTLNADTSGTVLFSYSKKGFDCPNPHCKK